MYFVYGKGYWVECKLQDLFHIEIKLIVLKVWGINANLNLCMTKIHWNQIIHIHQNTSVYKPKIYWFLHDQSSLKSIHDHLSSFFSHFNVDTKQFCIEISCYFMNQNYGSLKRLFLKFDISFMFAQCAWNEFAHIHTQFFFHLITCLEQSKFVKANVLDQYDKETEIFF